MNEKSDATPFDFDVFFLLLLVYSFLIKSVNSVRWVKFENVINF